MRAEQLWARGRVPWPMGECGVGHVSARGKGGNTGGGAIQMQAEQLWARERVPWPVEECGVGHASARGMGGEARAKGAAGGNAGDERGSGGQRERGPGAPAKRSAAGGNTGRGANAERARDARQKWERRRVGNFPTGQERPRIC